MGTDEIVKFQKLENALGNRYQAVNLLSKMSRNLGKANKEYKISESDLLTWVLTGNCPYTRSELEMRKFVADNDGVEEVLSWVSDEEVSNEVRSLYKQSVKQKHLIYCNNDNLSLSRRDRANILLRMIWYTAIN